MSRPLLSFLALAAIVVAAGTSSVSARTPSSLGGIPAECIATCQDGYQYATCTEDGHTINYFADPCLTHRSSSSSSSSSSSAANDCGPNAVLCPKNRKPSCIEGKWRCVKKITAVSSDSPVKITAFLPKYPRIGKRMTLQGEGFARNGNVVHIGDRVIPDAYSADGKHMTFLIPRIIKPACLFEIPSCKISITRLDPGTYDVFVETNGKMSNKLKVEIAK